MKIRAVFLLLIFTNIALGQIDKNFICHLSSQGLKKEHFKYISGISLVTTKDSADYYKCKYFLQYGEIEKMISQIKVENKLISADTFLMNAVAHIFITRPQREQNYFLSGINKINLPEITKNITGLISFSINNNITDSFYIPNRAKNSFMNMQIANKKKPVIASLLSAVFPGAGKLYVGKPKSFLNVFLLNILNGISVIETTRKYGIKNPYSVFCVSYSSLFYLANIYGSYKDVSRLRKEKRKKFLSDVSDYYNIYCDYPACR
ncbi:MAG: hypothetical protein ACK452_07130 [Bacteroidota bacterium]|jgi:hypothetical protein